MPLRFIASELGFNDAASNARSLRILAVRSDRLRETNLRIIENSWPRTRELADDFTAGTLDPDWIPEWGVVSSAGGRFTLLPLPRQTGAGVFLRGTEKWRDSVIEFDLVKHRKEFWAYARYHEDESWVRFGASNGYWSVEQKIGPRNLPTLLGRAPFIEDGLPARVRFVVKDQTVIVHVNGRMQFGRPLRMHPNVARGRVWLGVYDPRSRSALAVLTRFRAGPVQDAWIAFKDGGARVGFDESRLDVLREEAVHARAISPRWLTIGKNGSVAIAREQETLIRSLAGFYGCRLVPMAEFPAAGAPPLSDAARSERLLAGLGAAARALDAPGVNIRLRGADLERRDVIDFLGRLRAELRAARRQVWVTADGPGVAGAAAALPVDGVLRSSLTQRAGYELLEAVPAPPAKSSFKELAIK